MHFPSKPLFKIIQHYCSKLHYDSKVWGEYDFFMFVKEILMKYKEMITKSVLKIKVVYINTKSKPTAFI